MNSPPTTQLTTVRWIVINSSGGKDSQTALRQVVVAADAAGVPRDRLVVSHQCLGEMEWPGTLDLVKRQAACYGLRLEISAYRDKQGAELSLLAQVERRRMWPSNKQRYCTSDNKRGPGLRVIVKLCQEAPGDVLNVFGFRAEESPARAKKQVFVLNARASNQSRTVWDWCPILDWTEAQVWKDIRQSGVPHHWAYDKGMPRLSCVFCIFAPRNALLIAGQHNPELLARYVQVEKKIDHTFRQKQALAEIQTALANGEQPGKVSGAWNM